MTNARGNGRARYDRAPDEPSLRDAAVSYLARFAATQASLRRVLERKVDRWVRLSDGADPAGAARARAAIPGIVARLVEAGAVSDATFAEARARRLARSGRSRRAVAAHLAAKGVDAETAARVLPDEVAPALVFARRRRIGPFRTGADADRPRELAIFGRAGFAVETAMRVLAMKQDEAEAMIAGRATP